MSNVELELLEALVANPWERVAGMVTPADPDPSALLDVVFWTQQQVIRIAGKAHSVQDEMEEAFSLAIFKHVSEGWWSNSDSNAAWKARFLSDEWERESLTSVISGPREHRLYSDPRLKLRVFPRGELFDVCSAIEFVARGREDRKRLVLKASNDSPCCVEIGTSPEACDRLLGGLQLINQEILGCLP